MAGEGAGTRWERLKSLTGQPGSPVDGDMFYNQVMDEIFIYDQAEWVAMYNVASSVAEESVKRKVRALADAVDVAMEAIEMSHDRGGDGKCRARCPGCAVRERIVSLATARRLME